MENTHFAIGVHLLTALAFRNGEVVPSEELAASVNTSAAFIRQVLTELRRAGLVESRLGKGGGSLLAKEAHRIPLDEVYAATTDRPPLALHRSKPNQACPVGRNIQPALSKVIARGEQAMLAELHAVTVADIVSGIIADAVS